jgi:hypothetical protein
LRLVVLRPLLRAWTLSLAPSTRKATYLRPKPIAEELRQDANDLLYEVQTVSNTAALFDDEDRWNDGHSWQSKTLYMANLESFLGHMRALMDFVCPPMNVSPFLGPPPGVSGATSAIIAPGK